MHISAYFKDFNGINAYFGGFERERERGKK
jgi:hypothetical protein